MSESQGPVLRTLLPVIGPVFHYTNSQGLLGMLETKVLWASEASSLNDLAEVRQGWDLIYDLLKARPHSEGRDTLLEVPDWSTRRQNEVFVLSASTASDDANQWRGYAGNDGYAVGLDTTRDLAVRTDAHKSSASADWADIGAMIRSTVFVSPWYQVLYDEQPLEAALDELIAEVPRIRARAQAEPTWEDANTRWKEEEAELWHLLGTLAHLVKAPGWRGENEVRIVATAIIPEAHIQHRAGTRGITSYMELTGAAYGHPQRSTVFNPNPLPITTVKLGPGLPGENRATITRLLNQSGVTATVSSSSLPMR